MFIHTYICTQSVCYVSLNHPDRHPAAGKGTTSHCAIVRYVQLQAVTDQERNMGMLARIEGMHGNACVPHIEWKG